MANTAKCARPACECVVSDSRPYGQYCSEECREARQITELHCTCPHDSCRHPQGVEAAPLPSA